MAEQKAAEPEKKGYFARRRERKDAARPLPAKPAAAPARPAATPRSGPAGKPSPGVPGPETRYSLESIPEVEKRIDRMAATERRQRLLERYEARFGERLEVPKVFVSIEDEKKAEAASAADGMAGGTKEIPEDRLAAVTGMAPSTKAAPPSKPAVQAQPRPGLFGSKPAPIAAKPQAPGAPGTAAPAPPRPAVPAAARPAVPPAARPAAPSPRPAAPPPELPEGMSLGKYLWPAVWPFWGLIARRYAKFRYPENKAMINGLTVVDIPLLVILFLPRLFLIFWVGLALALLRKQKAKKGTAAQAAAEEPPAVTD